MSEHLNTWVKRISAAPLPVLGASAAALRKIAISGNYNGSDLTRSLAHDPLICLQLLRLVNRRFEDGRVATLEHAAVMVGEGQLRELASGLGAFEDKLPEPAREPLLQFIRVAFHVAYLARDFTRRNRDHRYDEAYYAGLLHGLGELVMRVVAPAQIPAIVRLAQRKGIGRNQAARELLGFDFHELSRALAAAWNLPVLLRAALDSEHFQDKRAQLVDVSTGIVQGGAALLEPQTTSPVIERLGEILNVSSATAKAIAFRANAAAVRELLDRLPGPSNEELVELYPPLPSDGFEVEERAASGERRPEALRRLAAVFASSEGDRLTPNKALEMFTAAMREGLGLDRVLFALLAADHSLLQGRFFRGIDPNSELHGFEFQRDGDSLFAKMLDKPTAIWVNAGNRARLGSLLTEHVRRVLRAEEFVAYSVFIRGRPVGLCYADRAPSRRPILHAEYEEFKRQCQLVSERLAGLLGKAPRKPPSA